MKGRTWKCCLVVFVASILLIGTCQAFTLSSKMIHRFSDEAKDIWTQKHGNAPGFWPRKGSAQYYELLRNHDHRRNHRRELIAEYQSLYFSQGNETVEFGESFGWQTPVATDLISDLRENFEKFALEVPGLWHCRVICKAGKEILFHGLELSEMSR
eukprot:Gb_20911 [translate_table: standard]